MRKKLLRYIRQIGIKKIYVSKAFHGSGYGGWMICPENIDAESVVYSFGVGDDASFDREIIEHYGVDVYAYDPTPRSISWVADQDWPSNFHFYPYGIAAEDNMMEFYPPENADHISHTIIKRDMGTQSSVMVEMKRLGTIADQNNHSKIDIIKLDIEGAEYSVIPDILGLRHITINQILVEFHHQFPEFSRRDTYQMLSLISDHGYRLFHVSDNGREFSFIQ